MGEVTYSPSVIGDLLDAFSNSEDLMDNNSSAEILNSSSIPFCTSHHLNLSAHFNEGMISIQDLKYLTYGILWPSICVLGIVGNVLNLIVLNQPNMKGTAYIYMRGYSSAALMAIIVAIPFSVRVLSQNEVGPWSNFYQAFFHTYLELYLGNSCLGIGVMMLVALTMERFFAVHPEKSRALQGSKKAYIIIASIPLLTLAAHSPHMLRAHLVHCQSVGDQMMKYQGKENQAFLQSYFYVAYKWFIGMVFRFLPTILLAYLNILIMSAYRRTCAKRRIMTGKTSRDESKKFAEESRIMMLLGSTSVLFFVCVTPMVILSLIFNKEYLKIFAFQVFRSIANLLELTNYSLTFYIYCLFSREFRNTFCGLFKRKVVKGAGGAGGNGTGQKASGETGKQRTRTSTPVDVPGSSPLL